MMSGLIGSPPTGRRTPPAGPEEEPPEAVFGSAPVGGGAGCVRPAAPGGGKAVGWRSPRRVSGGGGTQTPLPAGDGAAGAASVAGPGGASGGGPSGLSGGLPGELLELAVRNPEALDLWSATPQEKDAQPAALWARWGIFPADEWGPRWGCALHGETGQDGPEWLRPHRPGLWWYAD